MSDSNSSLTQARLMELLHYDPDTGLFTRLGRALGPGHRNRPAGGARELGYIMVRVAGGRYRAHRLAWLYMNGAWPQSDIDHIDGDPGNNRFSNLREASRLTNAQNTKKPTGVEHCSDTPRAKPWRVRIYANGRQSTVGYYATEEEAKEARMAAKIAKHPGYVPPQTLPTIRRKD